MTTPKRVQCIACKGKGYVHRRVDYRRLSDLQKKKILALYRAGAGYREIARKVEVEPGSVHYYIKTCNNQI